MMFDVQLVLVSEYRWLNLINQVDSAITNSTSLFKNSVKSTLTFPVNPFFFRALKIGLDELANIMNQDENNVFYLIFSAILPLAGVGRVALSASICKLHRFTHSDSSFCCVLTRVEAACAIY